MKLQDILEAFLKFIDTVLIPFLFILAILVLVWNITRYFILKGQEEASRERAKRLTLWGVIALVVIIGLWGLVALVMTIFGFAGNDGESNIITPDYMAEKGQTLEPGDSEYYQFGNTDSPEPFTATTPTNDKGLWSGLVTDVQFLWSYITRFMMPEPEDDCVLDPFGPGCNPTEDPCWTNPTDPMCNPGNAA